ncbi:hypothetical protein AAG570_012842 [Ranatra chinensis]|uniref:RNA-directed DNA polymerase n=1 Tax=Ranatra chinensis TaxID=642074 RepID=A0ABD0YXG7_9HEMI
MPFGLKTAPTTFQRLMDEFLEGLDPDAIQIYMDDIIVFSKSAEEHVSARGVATNDAKVGAIKRLLIPKDPKEVKSFQGLVGYYRKFIPNLADRLAPWTKLLKKGVKFVVTPKWEFEGNKEAFVNAPVLRYPNFAREFVLTTDASGVAVGAVLSQVEDGEDRPIVYASRKLTDAEARYPVIEGATGCGLGGAAIYAVPLGQEVSGEDRPQAARVGGPSEGKLIFIKNLFH